MYKLRGAMWLLLTRTSESGPLPFQFWDKLSPPINHGDLTQCLAFLSLTEGRGSQVGIIGFESTTASREPGGQDALLKLGLRYMDSVFLLLSQ